MNAALRTSGPVVPVPKKHETPRQVAQCLLLGAYQKGWATGGACMHVCRTCRYTHAHGTYTRSHSFPCTHHTARVLARALLVRVGQRPGAFYSKRHAMHAPPSLLHSSACAVTILPPLPLSHTHTRIHSFSLYEPKRWCTARTRRPNWRQLFMWCRSTPRRCVCALNSIA